MAYTVKNGQCYEALLRKSRKGKNGKRVFPKTAKALLILIKPVDCSFCNCCTQ